MRHKSPITRSFSLSLRMPAARIKRSSSKPRGRSSGNDGSIDITLPIKAGSHMVGVTFEATNYRPSLDMIRQYERKSLEDNPIPHCEYHPAVGVLRIRGPFSPRVLKTRAVSARSTPAIPLAKLRKSRARSRS